MNVHSKALLVASLTMALAACSSGPDPNATTVSDANGTPVPVVPNDTLPTPVGQMEKPSGSAAAQQFFVQEVFPVLTDVQKNSEACGNCHAVGLVGAPAFLAGSAQVAYKVFADYNGGALRAIPERNLLLTKDRHEGPALNGNQRGIIVQWLALEYPNLPPVAGIKTVFDALFNFGNCMNRTQFVQTQVANIPLTTLADNAAVNCTLCHNINEASRNGGNFVLDADANITFDNMKQFPGMLKLVTPVPGSTGAFASLQESFRIERHGEEPNLVDINGSCNSALNVGVVQGGGIIDVFAADYCHPNYDIPENVQDELEIFVGDTLARATLKVCSADNNPGGQ
jgi:hypothetical protein